MGKTIREFATEFSIDIKQVQNKVTYIRRKNREFGRINKYGVREFSPTEIQHLKEALNVASKTTELSTESSNGFDFLKAQLEEKDKQISMLQQALDQQQILTKQVIDDNKYLQSKLGGEVKKGFWKNLFNFKKKKVSEEI